MICALPVTFFLDYGAFTRIKIPQNTIFAEYRGPSCEFEKAGDILKQHIKENHGCYVVWAEKHPVKHWYVIRKSRKSGHSSKYSNRCDIVYYAIKNISDLDSVTHIT